MSMNCMKCGRETVNNQVFCNECLADMEKYPVRPGTVIHLPRRREDTFVKKSPRRKSLPAPEEQVKILKKQVRRLRFTVLIFTLLLVVFGYFAVVHFMEQDIEFLPGQNYSSMTEAGEVTPE